MTDEKELIRRRASYKGRLTTFVNHLKSLTAKTMTDSEARELRMRIGKVELLYEQYDEVQLQLECLADNQDTQLAERADFESIYYKTMSIAQGILNEYEKNDSAGSDKSSRSGNHRLVKLPTIQLPKFSGSYDNWLEFHDTFNSLIHSNDEIDNINKFHYLRASLDGSAAVVIQSIEFSADNYDVAWKSLCERFDNKRLLIQNHVSALFNIEMITRESSLVLKRLIDQINKNLRALESLGEPVKHWDTLLIHIITHKLDQKTYREWEEYRGNLDSENKITYEKFIQFLRSRADLIETLEMSRSAHSSTSSKSSKLKSMVSVQGSSKDAESPTKRCPKCNGEHNLNTCPQFLALSNEVRLKLLPNYKVCYNCFKGGHFSNVCKKPGCKICKRRHNTLVHVTDKVTSNKNNDSPDNSSSTASLLAPVAPVPSAVSASTDTDNSVALSANVVNSNVKKQTEVLLSTALIILRDHENREHVVRAVLDSGSTSSLITENLCKKLNLPTREIDRSILGINNVTSHIGKVCRVNIESLDNSFIVDINCFVLPSITNNLPAREINISDFKIPPNICLADPMFYKPSEVDILIGADLFWDLLGSEQIKLGKNKPVLWETRLGWVISGVVISHHASLIVNDISCNFVNLITNEPTIDDSIQTQLMRFWQLEEIDNQSSKYSPEEKLCEEHFVQNVSRQEDGRFCVRIPLKQSPDLLGDSQAKAKRCLLSLERRLSSNSELNVMYHDFMREYETMGHMSEFQISDQAQPTYFMPHHGVLRESSLTTKLRVVFNASSPTTSGVSLNDIQMVGPTVQDDLLSILLRFRQHKYILSADVEKMYRQIVVHPSDRHLQQILWRDDVTGPIKIYQLNTVTYGTASAPFLATRCLKQVANDIRSEKPLIAEIIEHDFYVDDLLTGGDDLIKVKEIHSEVTAALLYAGMPLRKWVSNDHEVVSDVSDSTLNLNIGTDEPSKLLGLGWMASSDTLCFPFNTSLSQGNSKRDLLSAISKIFDPLGLLAPGVILMKMLLQKLWLNKLSWDEPLSSDIQHQWTAIVKSLPLLNQICIPRLVVCDSYTWIELHVFTDASESAYGACVYIRSASEDGTVLVRLLMAKSRVAPIKPTTIPRLELCGALVGARLYEKVCNSLRLKINHVYFWTDSTIVLGWLQMLPSKLQPFVRNRVAEILERAGDCTWRHVPTEKNPADLISRGVDIGNLYDLDLWWSGPDYLKNDYSKWPSQPKHTDQLPETRPKISLNVIVVSENEHKLINFSRFSNYYRLVRTVAYVLRFIRACRKQTSSESYLQEHELRNALNVIIRESQNESFPEYQLLKNKKELPNKSNLKKLNVFLDENNIMRVGGRLQNSNFSNDKKHPIILQSTHVFTKLLFHHEHLKLFHAGPQLLLSSIRESYWPIGGRNLAKSCYHKCVRCTRMKGKTLNPLMGNLPQQRVLSNGFPFENVGVDYAGPIMCADRKGRGCKLIKTYIAIFICFTTKAMHLELVSDLTSNSYLCALRRFISRRGKPLNIYSDNGTSFVGAFNEISNFLKSHNNSLGEDIAKEGIDFKFIPPYAPHFGGLWEAGVKSTKFHLQRVLGNCNLTFEELYTTLTQIEAILNSRPLTPLSSDPADCTPLTPGHFIIGRSLTSLPDRDLQNHNFNYLTRFQRIEQLRQHFWSRWSKEYIAELQHRVKWRSCKDTLKLNSMVVVKDDNLPPLKWRLGRIVSIHTGSDGIARVANIKTSSGIIRRAFSKICPLPLVSQESG